MKKLIFILSLPISILFLNTCSDFLEPNPFDGTYNEDYVWSTPSVAEGILMEAFINVNPSSWRVQNNELAAVLTDDAVSSNLSSVLGNFAQGQQSPYNNLAYLDTWTADYQKIFNINLFLENIGSAPYDPDSLTNQRFIGKYKGDAYFLRAWYHWKLLKRYGGLSEGQVMGVPIVKKPLSIEESYDIARSTYIESVEAIIEDCDSALRYVPEAYSGDDLVEGVQYYGAPTQAIVKSLIGIVYIFAASPAFNPDNDITLWDSAASKISQALIYIDGSLNTDALPPRDFHNPENPDVIWRSVYQAGNYDNEVSNYPPSLRGNGLTNPTQNLVNLFPDSLGYPISESNIFDPENPYQNRDKRFYETIIYNGAPFSSDTTGIETYIGGSDSREVNNQTGTRTGYYLKKLLSANATLYPERIGVENTFYVSISKTDLYLLFCEAMNELAGPYDSRYGQSARNTMVKVRKRAGINPDSYLLLTAAQGKEDFRTFIRNERRIELCFEDKRYWDLRRWGELGGLNVDLYGVDITMQSDSSFKYAEKVIESRKYSSIYNPLPYEEVLKMNNVSQNEGW